MKVSSKIPGSCSYNKFNFKMDDSSMSEYLRSVRCENLSENDYNSESAKVPYTELKSKRIFEHETRIINTHKQSIHELQVLDID